MTDLTGTTLTIAHFTPVCPQTSSENRRGLSLHIHRFFIFCKTGNFKNASFFRHRLAEKSCLKAPLTELNSTVSRQNTKSQQKRPFCQTRSTVCRNWDAKHRSNFQLKRGQNSKKRVGLSTTERTTRFRHNFDENMTKK